MSITNTSKSSTSLTNLTRVFSGTTWDTETHTWNNDPYTWDQKITNVANSSKPSTSVTNVLKPS